MNRLIKSAKLAALTLPVIPAIFWLGGFDFNERGFVACQCFVWTCFSFGLATFIASETIYEKE